jgi:seryl-tRNA synthetase
MTRENKPLAFSRTEAARRAATRGAIRPLKEQVKERYAAHTAAHLEKVIKTTKEQIASSLQNVKTMPELMHEVNKTLDALISELSQKDDGLSGKVKESLTQLVFITSSDAILGSLEEAQKEKAAAEKAAADKAAAEKAAAEKAAAEKAKAEKAAAKGSGQEGQGLGLPPSTETV